MGVLYEHWRTDLNECFYVGISWDHPDTRPYDISSRNYRHEAALLEIKENNASVEVRIIECSHLNKDDLAQLERYQISYFKDLIGNRLTNIHPGGGGMLVEWDEEMRARHSAILKVAQKKRWDEMPQEERDAHAAATAVGLQKWAETHTEEEFIARMKPLWDGSKKRSSEERSETMRKWQANKTPEERRAAAQKGADSQTPEQRRNNALMAAASRTYEQRCESARKGIETRRRNKFLKSQQVPQ